MPLTEANVEQIATRVVAITQRIEEVREIASLLLRSHFWRSRDGSLTAGSLTPDDRAALETRIKAILGESEAIIATVRGMMAPEKPDAL